MSQIGNMGGPTPRRSNRLSTKASSVAAESAVTQMTSGGTSLRRKGPLTKVKARKSNAYGASGRVGYAEELSVSTTGFAQAFQTQRGDAVARDDEEEEDEDDIDELGGESPLMSGALNGVSHRQSSSPVPDVPSRAAPGLSFMDSEDITPSDDDLAASVGNTSKSFGMNHEGGMLFPSERRATRFPLQADSDSTPIVQRYTARRTIQARIQPQAPAPASTQGRPARAPATPKQLRAPVIQTDRAAIEQSVDELIAEERARMQSQSAQQSQPQQQSEWRQSLLNILRPLHVWLAALPWKNYLKWASWVVLASLILGMFSSAFLSPYSSESAHRAPRLGTALASRVSYQVGKLAEFIAPPGPPPEPSEDEQFRTFRGGKDDVMWERMGKLDKKYSTRFNSVESTIDVLKNELPLYMVLRKHDDGRQEITDEFWHALVGKARSNEDSPEWNEFLRETSLKIKGISGVVREPDSSTSWDHIVSRDEFAATMEQHYKTISASVDEKISEAIRGQNDQIKAIVQVEARKTMMDNIRLQSLAQTNLVANYELHLRKPNYLSPGLGALVEPFISSATLTQNPNRLARFFRWLADVPQRNPPQTALSDWNAPGDCWCSAPNPAKGQMQLAVSLGRPMKPKQVTIEHVPMSMVPAGDISDAPRDMELWVETDAPVKFHYNHRQSECKEGLPGWECLGTFKYNIHASNHLQTFELDAEPSIPISKAMLRVVTNWGAEHTCLYQVRLHGQDAAKDYEYEVRLNDPI